MITSVLVFIVFVIAASLIQVSLVPLPLGLAVILIWFILRGTKHIVWLILIFAIILATVSNLSPWAILLATTISSYLFIFGKSFLPDRPATTFGLLIISALAWEIFLVALTR